MSPSLEMVHNKIEQEIMFVKHHAANNMLALTGGTHFLNKGHNACGFFSEFIHKSFSQSIYSSSNIG